MFKLTRSGLQEYINMWEFVMHFNNHTNTTRRPASAHRTARRQFQAGLMGDTGLNWWLLGKPVVDCMFAVIKLFSISLTAATLWGEVCATHVLPMGVGPFGFRYQGNGATPCQYIDTTRKAIDCATTFSLFLYNETVQQTSRPLLSKLPERRQI